MEKQAMCKCGHPLMITNGFPRWVYCENPPCDYVQIWGDWMMDSMFGRYSENKFAKEGPFKGHYEGILYAKKINDIKPMYVEPSGQQLLEGAE